MVRYGEEKQGYVVALIPDDKAPIVIPIEDSTPGRHQETTSKAQPIEEIFQDQSQAYYTLGLKQQGVTLMVTNILHQGSATYLRFFIDNQTALPCKLSPASFAYIYSLRSFLFLSKEQREVVVPRHSPKAIQLPPCSGDYFVFAIPAQASAEGPSITFSMQESARNYQLCIPSNVLLTG